MKIVVAMGTPSLRSLILSSLLLPKKIDEKVVAMQFELTPLNLSLYGAALVGVLLGAYRAIGMLRTSVNIPAMNQQIIKLVAADNVERALKLCKVAPQAIFSRILRSALEAVLDLRDSTPAAQAARLEEVFTQDYERILAQDTQGPLLSLAAVFLGALPFGIGIATTGVPSMGLLIVGGAAVVAGLFAWQHDRRRRRDVIEALPPIAAALRRRSK